QQGRNYDRNCDQQASHGRSAGFLLMRLGSLFAYELADLKLPQTVDDDRADNKCGKKSSETGERRTKSQIPENAEWRKVVKQFQVQQPIEQSASVSVESRQSSQSNGQECSSAVFDLLTAD